MKAWAWSFYSFCKEKKEKKCVSADTHTILQQDKRLAFGIYYSDFQNGAAHTLLSISKYYLRHMENRASDFFRP